jgi:catechol 2,3-dioxygenase-like lactoylglutathione lyase family enzyme
MGVRRVVPDLSSTSPEAAKGFYGDILGLRPVMDHGWIVTLADPEQPGAPDQPHDLRRHPLSSPMSRFRWMR